jgi:hypothetical protein
MCYHCCVFWITNVGLNQARTQSHSTVTLLWWTQAPPYHNNTSLYCSSAVIPCSHSLSWSLFYELATKYSCTVNCTYIALVQHGIQAGLFYHLYKSCRTLNEGIVKLNLSHYCFQEIGSNTLELQWLLKQIIGTCWFCGPHLFWSPFHCYSFVLSTPHIVGNSFY